MSRLEYWLWGVDFMIGGIGYFSVGPYAGMLCFFIAGILIFIGLTKKDKGESAGQPNYRLVDATNRPYVSTRAVKKWHKWGLAIFAVLSVILVGYGAVQRWGDSPIIHIRGVEIGWIGPEERIMIQPTDLTLPNKQWAANIHYTSTATQEIVLAWTASLPKPIPADTKARNDFEDQEWERTVNLLRYNQDKTFKVTANSPKFNTLDGPSLDQQQLCDMIAHKTAVYFIAAFERKGSSLPQAGVCIYREGVAPIVHNCHDHNFP
jgi:hypothetical protein